MPEKERAGEAGGEEEPVFVVQDEDGVEREMVPACTFDYDGNDYVVLIDRNDGDADGLILRIEQDGEEIVLANIEDDDEWDAVMRIYEEMLGSEEED